MAIKYTPGPVVKKPPPKSAYSSHLGPGTLSIGGKEIAPLTELSVDLGDTVTPEVLENLKEYISKPAGGQSTLHKKDLLVKEDFTHFAAAPIPKEELCTVTVGGSQTVNLGNYESAKISVSATIPCTKESMDDAYEFVSTWVSSKIEDAIKEAKKGAG
jgi:hypothetical protein